MNLKPIINEMPDRWLGGESGGQRLEHYLYGHWKLKTKEARIAFWIRIFSIPLYQDDPWDILIREDFVMGDN